MKTPAIVSAQEWETAHRAMLVEEKALTRARDALAAKRRRMPWTEVDTSYRFEGPDGAVSLLDLFQGAASSSCIAPSSTRAPVTGPSTDVSAAR
ncbi:CalU12 protein [Mycobacteroides abscessus]|nr:CalU12 protein [Mycobacteroides abscessus]